MVGKSTEKSEVTSEEKKDEESAPAEEAIGQEPGSRRPRPGRAECGVCGQIVPQVEM